MGKQQEERAGLQPWELLRGWGELLASCSQAGAFLMGQKGIFWRAKVEEGSGVGMEEAQGAGELHSLALWGCEHLGCCVQKGSSTWTPWGEAVVGTL